MSPFGLNLPCTSPILHYCPNLLVAEVGRRWKTGYKFAQKSDTYNGCCLPLDWKVISLRSMGLFGMFYSADQ